MASVGRFDPFTLWSSPMFGSVLAYTNGRYFWQATSVRITRRRRVVKGA